MFYRNLLVSIKEIGTVGSYEAYKYLGTYMLRNFISKLPMLIKYWFLQRNEKPFPKFVLQRTRWVMGKMHAAGPQTL